MYFCSRAAARGGAFLATFAPVFFFVAALDRATFLGFLTFTDYVLQNVDGTTQLARRTIQPRKAFPCPLRRRLPHAAWYVQRSMSRLARVGC